MTGTPIQPDFETMSGDPTLYKEAIEGSIAAAARIAWSFAPHEQDTPNMTVRLEAGALLVNDALVEVAAQNTATITAPTGNPRIDRVVLDATTGTVSVVTGTEAASPSPPDIPAGKLPCAQVLLDNDPVTTAIINTIITDERILGGAGGGGQIPVGGIYQNITGANPATEVGYGTWEQLIAYDRTVAAFLQFEGTGATITDSSPWGHPITATGGATQSTSQYKFGAKSLSCPGAGDYIQVGSSPPKFLLRGSEDWTVDFWFRLTTATGVHQIFYLDANNRVYTSGTALYIYWAGGSTFTIADPIALNTWHHLRLANINAVLHWFLNGTRAASSFDLSAWNQSTAPLLLGGDGASGMLGFIDQFLVTKNILSIYDFTPDTIPYVLTKQWRRTA